MIRICKFAEHGARRRWLTVVASSLLLTSVGSAAGPAAGAAGAETHGSTSGHPIPSVSVLGARPRLLSLRALASAAATVSGTIDIDGAPVQLTLPAGDNARITFTGSNGQKLGLGFSAVSGPGRSASVLTPSGATLTSTWVSSSGSGGELDLALTANGTYTIVVDPSSSASGSVTLTLSSDLVLPIAVDGDSTRVTITRPGQNARLTFTGAAGDHLGLAATEKTGAALALTLLKPVGSTSLGQTSSAAASEFDVDLAVDGGYTVFVDPTAADTPAATFTLSHDILSTIFPDVLDASVAIARPGQNASISFAAQAGDHIGIGLSASSIPHTFVTLLNAGGSRVGSLDDGMTYFSGPNGSGELDAVIPTTGSYRIFVDPDPDITTGISTGSLTVTVTHDVETTIQVGGPAVTVQMGRSGQNGRAFVDLLVGQSIQITYSNVATVITARLRRPDGQLFKWGAIGTVGSTTWTTSAIGPAPVSGRYELAIDPYAGAPSSVTVKIDGSPGFSAKIYGFANVGQTVVAAAEGMQPPADSLTYQWQRCDANGASCADVVGQASVTYTLGEADRGSRLRVREVAGNIFGSTTVLSDPSSLVLSDVQSLAVNYRPALLFDSGEYWRPLSVDSLLAEATHRLCVIWLDPVPSQPWCNEGVTDAEKFKHWVNPTTQQDTDTYTLGPATWVFLDLATIDGEYKSPTCAPSPPGAAHILRDCDDGGPAVIYYDYGQDGLGYRYIDYWIFYRDNTITGDDHEGDWEGLTVVLNGSTTDPRVAGVLFAQHTKLQWRLPTAVCWGGTSTSNPDCINGQPQGSGHVTTYPANGTHASYEVPCSDNCPNPEGGVFPEGDHDGASAWGMNTTCPSCVQSLPVGGEVWARWPGHWGEDQPDAFGLGESPTSPGTKSRYICTQAGWNCPERQPGMPAFFRRSQVYGTSARIPTPARCRNWGGVSVVVLACDPRAIMEAFQRHQTDRRGPFHITVAGRRSGDTLGVVQVLGRALEPGERIRLRGKPTPATSLEVRANIEGRSYIMSARRIELSGTRASLEIGRSGQKPVFRHLSGMKLRGVRVRQVPQR